MQEATRLCCSAKSDPDTEDMSRTLAEKVIATLMAKEDPDSPHYPLAIVDALAERYRLDLGRYTVNERHAAVIRGG
jgi:DNA-directed RNA polymerase specialized sigma54-like protein